MNTPAMPRRQPSFLKFALTVLGSVAALFLVIGAIAGAGGADCFSEEEIHRRALEMEPKLRATQSDYKRLADQVVRVGVRVGGGKICSEIMTRH